MNERPLILFPIAEPASRAHRFGAAGNINLPPPERRFQRLRGQFRRLNNIFKERAAALRMRPDGTAPEEVLVIESLVPIPDFYNAVRRINGLEWLAGTDAPEFEPDDDYFDIEDPAAPLDRRIFLIFANQQGMREVRRLWLAYTRDPDMKFPHGLGRFKQMFSYCSNIRVWNHEDRILETGAIPDWTRRIDLGQDQIPFEIELWFRQDKGQRGEAERHIRQMIKRLGGRVVNAAVLPQIRYHALAAELAASHLVDLIERPETSLLVAQQIMYVRPSGQTGDVIPSEVETQDIDGEWAAPSRREPVVALFDGVPIANHAALAGHIIVDDPDGMEPLVPARERVHGTGMASLIIRGDLSTAAPPLPSPLYVRPVMIPKASLGASREAIPDAILPTDLIHSAVVRLFGTTDSGGIAQTIRIVNLSIGDPSRPFLFSLSPWARLIDWLSWQYKILFLISAGNYGDPLAIDLPNPTVPDDIFEDAVLRHLTAISRNRRLLSPAEAINAVTVAAANTDAAGAIATSPNARIALQRPALFAPYNAHGPGFRRAIKPDILMPGGRAVYREPLLPNRPLQYTYHATTRAPGNRVAAPGTTDTDTNATAYSRGTSNAAALASRLACMTLHNIRDIYADNGVDLSPASETVLTKAILAHGASWSDELGVVHGALPGAYDLNEAKKRVANVLGYGLVAHDRLFACTPERATLLTAAELANGEAHIYRIPLPPGLAARRTWRALRVTLAYFSPINLDHQNYRVAHLWFDSPASPLILSRSDAQWQAVQRGTLQHEIFCGEEAVAFVDGDAITIRVNCRADAGRLDAGVPYGLVATLEVTPGVGIQIYDEIRLRVRPRARIR